MSRGTVLAVAGWLAAALLAIVVGIVAIQLVGASITGTTGGVRSQDDIERALAATPPAPTGSLPPRDPAAEPPDEAIDGGPSTATRAPTSRPADRPGAPAERTAPATAPPTAPVPPASPRGIRRDFVVEGGTALAECIGGQARLVSWSPARGVGVEEVDRGPDEDVSVTFDGPDDDYELTIECVRGVPEAIPADDDD